LEVNRILDSCRDRDCFEDARVYLTDFGNDLLERTTNVRVTSACVAWTSIHLDAVKFNRGFYDVNIRFYIKLCFEACVGSGRSQAFDGVAVLEKKAVLFGGESNVKLFKSVPGADDFCAEPVLTDCVKNSPVAVVEVLDPVVLNTRILEEPAPAVCCCCAGDIPEKVAARLAGPLSEREGCGRYLAVSLGLFSVVRLIRPGQYLVQAAEYCVPDKECVTRDDDSPCDLFRSMAFPVAEFCTSTFPLPDHPRCGC
jgi:hypothetical protein